MLGPLLPAVHSAELYGHVLRFFNQANHIFYYNTSNPLNNPNIPDNEKAQIAHLIMRFQQTIHEAQFYGKLRHRQLCKEALDITAECAIHAVSVLLENSNQMYYSTMRSVLIGNILNLPDVVKRERLIGFALELHILQNLRHPNIVRLLSIHHVQQSVRYELFIEAALPLSYYVREVGPTLDRDAYNIFENDDNPRYILKCVAEVLDHLARHNLILGFPNWLNVIYISLNGVVRVGNFLRAMRPPENDISVLQNYELASLGGFFLALVHRFLPLNVVNMYGQRYPPIKQGYYRDSYLATRAALAIGPAAVNLGQPHIINAIPDPDLPILNRCLNGFLPYENVVQKLQLTNVPDMSIDLSFRVNNRATFFRSPSLTFQALHVQMPSLPVYVSAHWHILRAHLHLELGEELDSHFDITIGMAVDTKKQITNIITALVTFDPNNEDPPENDHPIPHDNDPVAAVAPVQEAALNEDVQDEPEIELPLSDEESDEEHIVHPFYFEPQHILDLYTWIVDLNNSLIVEVELLPFPLIPWVHLQSRTVSRPLNMPGEPARNLVLTMRIVGGQRDVLPDVVD
uniref:Protein kinase domain-containing protein n=1 Tax=Panagrellus redivivus TaxID=6233 RepID=A0A7E4V463_PANRE